MSNNHALCYSLNKFGVCPEGGGEVGPQLLILTLLPFISVTADLNLKDNQWATVHHHVTMIGLVMVVRFN